MEAKDTVMKLRKILDLVWSGKGSPLDMDVRLLKVAEAQAEISFKAGQESRCDWHKPLPQIIAESFSEGKKAGIKEVVEFVQQFLVFDKWYLVKPDEWKAKLKEWGVDRTVPHR